MNLANESEEIEIVLTTEDLHDLLGQLFIVKKIKNKEIKVILSDERV